MENTHFSGTKRTTLFDFATAEEILQRVFQHGQFRGLQSRIIQAVSTRQDTLVIMPTGMGKSLCFQIPALAIAESSGLNGGNPLTLVLSPLVALILITGQRSVFARWCCVLLSVEGKLISQWFTGSDAHLLCVAIG